jgi:hypothetical protein
MLSVNSAIVALYGYLQADKMAVGAAQKAVWLWAIPAGGAIVCLAWAALLTSYRKLNRAKFTVLAEIEADLSVPLFTREREAYRRDCRWSPALQLRVTRPDDPQASLSIAMLSRRASGCWADQWAIRCSFSRAPRQRPHLRALA